MIDVALKTLPRTRISFEFEQATVIYTNELSQATAEFMPRLFVQVIDSYGYQRELSVARHHRAGDSKRLYWEVHVYQHHLRRDISEVTTQVAASFILKFLRFCQDHSILLFQSATAERGRHGPLIHMLDKLHAGQSLIIATRDM